MSALSSNNLGKYEYLTGEGLSLKPSTIEQTKFECSPLGKIFNKGLDNDDKKEGLLKRLEIIKNTSLTQPQAIKDRIEQQLRELKKIDKSNTLKAIDEIRRKNDEANKMLLGIKKIDAELDKAELICTKTVETKFNDFNRFILPIKLINKSYNHEITLDEAIEDQINLKILINKLNNDYKPRNEQKKGEKKYF